MKINEISNEKSVPNGFTSKVNSLQENGVTDHIELSPRKQTELRIGDVCKPVSVKLIRYANIETDCPGVSKMSNGKYSHDSNDSSCDEISPSPSPPPTTTTTAAAPSVRRYPKRNRAPAVHFAVEQRKSMQTRNKTKPVESDFLDTYPTEWSRCEVSFRYDMEKKFFPEPGPSTVNYYDGVDLPGYYEPLKPKTKKRTKAQEDEDDEFFAVSSDENSDSDGKRRKKQRKRKTSPRQTKSRRTKAAVTKAQNDETIVEEDEGIIMKSFYGDLPGVMSFDSPCASGTVLPIVDSPDIDVTKIVKNIHIPSQLCQSSGESLQKSQNSYKIVSLNDPPSRSDTNKLVERNEIPKVQNRQPFYSDPSDTTIAEKIEVGHTVLKLTGNSLNDCEEFKSQLNIVGLYAWRKLNASNAIFPANGKKSIYHNNDRIRLHLSSDRKKQIEPLVQAPSRRESKHWFDRFKRSANAGNGTGGGNNLITETIVIDDDSDDEQTTTTTTTIDHSTKKSIDERSKLSVEDDDSSDDVICLDDFNETTNIDQSNRYKVSILSSSSSNSCRPISLRRKLSEIANELSVSTDKKIS